MRNKHEKFNQYWKSIGEPKLEFKSVKKWKNVETNVGIFFCDAEYRIKGDRHWELRLKWIDSDFTLPIGYVNEDGELVKVKNPSWFNTHEYKEMDIVNSEIDSDSSRLRNLFDILQEQKEDSPYSKEAWDELEAENKRLRIELKQAAKIHEECSSELFELKNWID